jgi:hypothetical protein
MIKQLMMIVRENCNTGCYSIVGAEAITATIFETIAAAVRHE